MVVAMCSNDMLFQPKKIYKVIMCKYLYIIMLGVQNISKTRIVTSIFKAFKCSVSQGRFFNHDMRVMETEHFLVTANKGLSQVHLN